MKEANEEREGAPSHQTKTHRLSSPPASPLQISKRGTVASRGGQMSRKEVEAQDDMFRAVEAGDAGSLPPPLRPGALAPPPRTVTRPPAGVGGPMQEVSPRVNDRMFRRMVTFAGVPVAVGIAFFPIFYYIKKVADVDLPTWVVYLFSTATFGAGLAGISYGALSASWDPAVEGSRLGVDEFKTNLGTLIERGQRRD